MDDDSKKLLIINTHIGLFRYERLSFGVKPAPTIFQEVMDKMTASLKNVACFMDDIFIYGKTKKEHDEALMALMTRLQDFNSHIKISKCKFVFNEIKYLGSITNSKRIQPDPTGVTAIRDMIPPINQTEIRSFLGSINY